MMKAFAARVTYELTSAGSAIVEKFAADQSHEM